MFKSLGLFGNTPCPEGEGCTLPSCIFNHTQSSKSSSTEQVTHNIVSRPGNGETEDERPLKKRRIQDGQSDLVSPPPPSSVVKSSTPGLKPVRPDVSRAPKLLTATKPVSPPARKASVVKLEPRSTPSKPEISILKRPSQQIIARPAVSKPGAAPTIKLPPKPFADVVEQLVPRKLISPPAPFPTRVQLAKLIYAEYIRLNKLVQESSDNTKRALTLSHQQMITLTLDEEEKVAKEQPTVYSNILKLRIKRLRDIKTLQPWKAERLAHIKKNAPEPEEPEKPAKKVLQSSLTPEQEVLLLPRLLTPISDLAPHGYVPQPPTELEIEEARKGVESAKCWEVCDRCQKRFQIFPHRRESDGALTTGGICTHHWGRARRPPRAPGQVGTIDDRWTCCGGDLGAKGCTTADSHVFKVSDPKRLASIMQFESVKTVGPETATTAVAFDCEMGYTSQGLELIRLTATRWPDGEELVDVLVRPIGEIIDLNSRFSGVWPEDWARAVPYNGTEKEEKLSTPNIDKEKKRQPAANGAVPTADPSPLKMVSSPQRARELLFEHLTTTTPLIGHAIDNDLNSARICHPTIIDTVLLFPANRPLPMRMGLKVLVKKHLDMDIQMGGARGHDSKEDARAAGELVKFKLAQLWKDMQREGWKLDGARLLPPEAK